VHFLGHNVLVSIYFKWLAGFLIKGVPVPCGAKMLFDNNDFYNVLLTISSNIDTCRMSDKMQEFVACAFRKMERLNMYSA